jgi:hypothetical protein
VRVFLYNDFVDTGLVRSRVIFLVKFLDWPIYDINIRPTPLQPLCYTRLDNSVSKLPVLTPWTDEQRTKPRASELRQIRKDYPAGAIIILSTPVREEGETSYFAPYLLVSGQFCEPLWVNLEQNGIGKFIFPTPNGLESHRVADLDGAAYSAWANTLHPEWQLRHGLDTWDSVFSSECGDDID